MMLVAAAVCLSGCTPAEYAQQADESAYGTLARGQGETLGEATDFDVNYRPLAAYGDSSTIEVGDKTIHLAGGGETQALTLDDCLTIAFRNSRDYQNRVETLYSQALVLANDRRSWEIPLFESPLDAEIEKVAVGKGGDSQSAAASAEPSITQRLVNGGVVTLAATLDWATDFGGDTMAGSMLRANFTQPLLQGAWRGFAYEDQYRLERNFRFDVYDFERFRQGFSAGIFTRYYQVLRQRDRLENEDENIKRLRQTFALTALQAEAGQVSRIQQDQAEQDLIAAQVRLKRDQQAYENALDLFKIELGLPIRANVDLDYPNALLELQKGGLPTLQIGEDESVTIVLMSRPDVLRERSDVRDAHRNIEIAADQFLPQLNLEFDISASSTPPTRFERVEFHRNTRRARATFAYDLDQTDNRDAYRISLIVYDRVRRDLDRFLDQVRLDVREAHRELARSRESYELQVRNVKVATRRSKLASVQQKEGQASARDVLEAEEGLRTAQNGLTAALVDYVTTRVEFLVTLGLIDVDERGMMYERDESFTFERIRQLYPYVGDE